MGRALSFLRGRDRFRVWPEEDGGRYWCRGCGKHGDAIQWLRDYRGLSFQEACFELGIDPRAKQDQSHEGKEQSFTPREAVSPCLKWQARAEDFLKQSVKDLWNNSEALSFLHGRGLQDETIRAACLGWNSMDRYEGREAWGLDPLKDERGKDKTVWLPSGLVIPLVDSISEDLHAVTRLRIRKPEGEPRYVIVSGSYTGPITWGMNKKVLCIVESELDGLLIEQEAGHLCGVIALGNAQAKPDRETHEALNQADLILISLDFDEAGAGASWKFWLTTYPNARRWPVPVGKDPGEAFQKGLSIRTWVEAGLRTETLSEGNEGPAEAEIRPFLRDWLDKYDDASLERLAIMTIDGRLSDGEAVQALFS